MDKQNIKTEIFYVFDKGTKTNALGEKFRCESTYNNLVFKDGKLISATQDNSGEGTGTGTNPGNDSGKGNNPGAGSGEGAATPAVMYDSNEVQIAKTTENTNDRLDVLIFDVGNGRNVLIGYLNKNSEYKYYETTVENGQVRVSIKYGIKVGMIVLKDTLPQTGEETNKFAEFLGTSVVSCYDMAWLYATN